MYLHADFISKVLIKADLLGGPISLDSSFSVDSRSINKGDIFVALIGAQVDGHDFLKQALEKGASGFILALDRKQQMLEKYKNEFEGKSILFVPDTLQALIDLAHAWRMQFNYPVCAITGSVGKTTTKEMVRNILKCSDLNYLVSFGNQNTLVGISLNILKMRPEHQAAVFELGIANRGSMKKLVQLLRPTYSLITAIGHGHMQGLGDIHTISYEKREIFSHFTSCDIGVINGDQPELAAVSYAHPVVRFGKKTTNQIQARRIVLKNNMISFTIKIYNQTYPVVLQSCLATRVMNALAAVAIGYLLKIPNDILIKGIEIPVEVPGRFQMIEHQATNSILIHDGYNSNPDSVKASLVAFNQLQTDKKKVLILADMLELGAQSVFWHRQLGRMVHKVSNLAHVVLIGFCVQATKKTLPLGVKVTIFESSEAAVEFLKSMLLSKDMVFLFKGSQSMNLSVIVKKLQEVK